MQTHIANERVRLGLRGAILDRVFLAAPECVSILNQDNPLKTNDFDMIIQSRRILTTSGDISR